MWMRRVFYVTLRFNRYNQTLLQDGIAQNALRQIVGKIFRSPHSPSTTSLEAQSDLVVQARLAARIVHSTVDDSRLRESQTVSPVDTALRSNERLDFGEILLFKPYARPLHPKSS